jgi:hypothetical protein
MAAPTAVTNLVDTFHRNRDAYRASSYNETQLRHEFPNTAQTPNEKTALQRQINTTDQQIDKLMYQLYNLTDDEIKIVENIID